MDWIINQLSLLLTTPPGNVTYYLVVGFSLAWTLQTAIARYSMRHSKHSQRLVWGLAVMLVMRLFLFLAIIIAEIINTPLDFLPPADRAVSVLSLIMIAWMWAFPEQSRSADGSGFIIFASVAVFFFINLAGWSGHDPAVFFNATLLGPLWEVMAIAVSAGGVILLFSRKTQNWGVGIWALGIQLIGSALTLAFPILHGNYAAFTRLGQMIAYPLLFTLTQYRHISSGDNGDFHEQVYSRPGADRTFLPQSTLLPLFNDFLDLEQAGLWDRYDILTRIIGHIYSKSIVLILLPGDRETHYTIAAWNGIKIPDVTEPIATKNLPLISNALTRGRTLTIPAENAAVDMETLKHLTKSEHNYHVLACPIQDAKKNLQAGILILRSDLRWTTEEQHHLNAMIPSFGQILRESRGKTLLSDEKLQELFKQEENIQPLDKKLSKDELRSTLSRIWVQNRQLRQTLAAVLENSTQDKEGLFPEIDALETLAKNINLSDLSREEAIEALSKALSQYRLDHETIIQLVGEGKSNLLQPDGENALQNIVTKLEAQNQVLQSDLKNARKENDRIKELIKIAGQQLPGDEKTSANGRPSSFDLQSTLAHSRTLNEEQAREITRLKQALRELQSTFRTHLKQDGQKDADISQQLLKVSSQQVTEIVAAIQELQYPLSTIVDYSDLVLDESVGSLGALQKKFLQRIKDSVHQLEEQINQLMQTSLLDSSKIGLSAGLFDLNEIVASVLSVVSNDINEKSLHLTQDLSPDLPFVQIDENAIAQILTILLRNAILASPVNGKIELKVHLKEEDGQQYTLIQVSDMGEGIPPEDVAQVFSAVYHTNRKPIPGVGNTEINLSIAKALVDAFKGRIWADSVTGKGTTYSVRLPLPYSIELGEKQR